MSRGGGGSVDCTACTKPNFFANELSLRAPILTGPRAARGVRAPASASTTSARSGVQAAARQLLQQGAALALAATVAAG